MKKITIKNLIQFRGKNERTKITFVKNLKKEKSNDSSGGDYWVSSLSAIRNTFKLGKEELLDEKIQLLNEKINTNEIERIKNQFQRNINIINNFKDYDLQNLRPKTDLTFIKQVKQQFILNIRGIPIEAKPCHLFTFSENNNEEIGGIWFIAQLDGFDKSELGMFSDIMYRYLEKHYSKKYFINPKYCIAVDLYNAQEVNYEQIKDGNIPILIDTTLDDLRNIK